MNTQSRIFREILGDNERKDVARLKGAIPELVHFPDFVVAALYRTYSEDCYAAGWIELPEGNSFANFEQWLFTTVSSPEYLTDWVGNVDLGMTPDEMFYKLRGRRINEPAEGVSNMMSGKDAQPGKHPVLATALLDEAAKLRARAREIERTPAPPPPSNDKTETFAKLWAEAWKNECGGVADRLGDAAKILEDAVGGLSPTHDLVNWRRS